MDEINQLPYLYLTTTGWKSGQAHQIEIWFTAWQECFYVIAEYGEQAHWVQNLQRQPAVKFRVGDQLFEGTARVIDTAHEPELQRQIAALSTSKYGWGDGLIVELKPDMYGGK